MVSASNIVSVDLDLAVLQTAIKAKEAAMTKNEELERLSQIAINNIANAARVNKSAVNSNEQEVNLIALLFGNI